MQYDAIYIRFGELFLKGRNKRQFIDKLFHTVQRKLSGLAGLVLERRNDHILVYLKGVDCQSVIQRLDFVFGLHSYALGRICESSLEAICQTALPMAIDACSSGRAIKFETRRGWKQFPLNSIAVSQQVAEYVGANAPEGTVRYNVAHPDQIVHIVIKKQHSLVVSAIHPASGGMPIGLNGRALLMLSGGLDSPVAGYLMMKRGMALEGIHFESPPHTTVRARQKVFDLAEKLAHYLPSERLPVHVVPFTQLQKEIFARVPEHYGMTIMRRMMYRVAEGIAERRGIRLLSNGESLGQVASQTPDSMWAINAVTRLPVVRPVACMDKSEIVEIARKIDTFNISIRPFEDCCTVFVPKFPVTAPTPEKCERFERDFEWQPLVDACIENTRVVEIRAGHPLALDGDTTEQICSLL